MSPKRKRFISTGIALVCAAAIAFSLFNQRPNALAAQLSQPPWGKIGHAELFERIETAYSNATHGFLSIGSLADLSNLYHANGYLGEARECYEALTKSGTNNPKLSHRHARILSTYGMQDDAIALYRKVIQQDPAYLPARIHLGNALLKSARSEDAETVFRQALELESSNAYALLGLARLRIGRGNWKDAKTILKVAVESSRHRIGVDLLTTVYQELGDPEAADQLKRAHGFGAYRDLADPWIDEILVDCYDPFRLATAAGMASFRGDAATARSLLERAIAIAPRDPMLHFQLGGISESAGDATQALEHYRRSVQLKSDFSDGWHHMFQIHRDAGNILLSHRILEQGFRNCPESPALLIEMADYMRREGRFSQAVELLRKSIVLRPNEAQAYLNLARLYFTNDQENLGVAAMEDALRVEPGHPMALTTLALNAINTKDKTLADRLMTRIRNQPKVDPEAFGQLATRYQTQFETAP